MVAPWSRDQALAVCSGTAVYIAESGEAIRPPHEPLFITITPRR